MHGCICGASTCSMNLAFSYYPETPGLRPGESGSIPPPPASVAALVGSPVFLFVAVDGRLWRGTPRAFSTGILRIAGRGSAKRQPRPAGAMRKDHSLTLFDETKLVEKRLRMRSRRNSSICSRSMPARLHKISKHRMDLARKRRTSGSAKYFLPVGWRPLVTQRAISASKAGTAGRKKNQQGHALCKSATKLRIDGIRWIAVDAGAVHSKPNVVPPNMLPSLSSLSMYSGWNFARNRLVSRRVISCEAKTNIVAWLTTAGSREGIVECVGRNERDIVSIAVSAPQGLFVNFINPLGHPISDQVRPRDGEHCRHTRLSARFDDAAKDHGATLNLGRAAGPGLPDPALCESLNDVSGVLRNDAHRIEGYGILFVELVEFEVKRIVHGICWFGMLLFFSGSWRRRSDLTACGDLAT